MNKNSFLLLYWNSTSFLCQVIANTSSFNAFSRNSINAHVYKHTYTPNDGRKNQLRFSQPYMVVNTLECLPLFVTALQGCNRVFATT